MALEAAVEKLKEIYFDLEDKWYALIDKIDSRIPVHGVIDRVDKIVPSFALFLALILLVAIMLVLPLGIPSGAVFSFKVTDTDGASIENANVAIFLDAEQIFSESTDEAGETGQVVLEPGTTVTVGISKKGFQDYTETIEVTESVLLYSIVLTSLEETTYNISLKDSLGQPIREPLTLSFACRNPDIKAPEDMEVFSGTATVTEPVNCNGLIVSVRGDDFEFKDSVELVHGQQTIYLQETVSGTSSVNVELYFNGKAVDDEIMVYLYKDNGTEAGLGPLESEASYNGIASFSVQPAAYFVKSSGYGMFAVETSPVFTIAAGEVKQVRLDLQQNIVGEIKLSIVDKQTHGFVDGAQVLLRLGGEEIDTKVTSAENEALVEFPVSLDTAYTVVIDHPGYCLRTVHDATIGTAVREIELTPFTDDCGGKLKIRVLNQDGKPVNYATTGLYTADGFSVGFANLVTDVNGEAEFSRVPSGNYKAFGFKGSSSGWSDAQHFVQRAAEKSILTVVLIAGDGAVMVNVSDLEGNPLQFANVTFIDARTLRAIGGGSMPVQDVNGTAELVTRADKRVYIVASKPGYTNFTSTTIPVVAGTIRIIDAVLEREIIQGEIKIVFKGMFKDGKKAVKIAPGQQYDALFQLRIPANRNYDFIGMHVRTGRHEIMELDKLVVKEINAAGNVKIIKATSYSPSNGYDVDSGHLSSDEAKWASLRWPVFSNGLIQVSARIRVKETANIGEQLNLFYRAWGEAKGDYKRDPIDSELGESESVPGKEGLYANAKQEIFQIGTETICDEKFCFSGSVLDLEDELIYNTVDGFSGKVFRPYKLLFTVINNSEFETNSYMDAEIRVLNSDSLLLLQDYTIYGAQSQQREGIVEGDSTDWIEIGNLLPDNRAQGEIYFTPQKGGFAVLQIEIRSGQTIQFSKAISINITSGREMDVLISPEILPSGIENVLTVTVKDKATGAEIENAIAKVRDRFGTVVAERSTNKKGVVELRLPALQPGEKLQLLIGKPNYETFEKTIRVNPAVVEVKPASIGVRLNAKTIFDAMDPFTVENITSFDLKIKDMELNGKLYGIVDGEKVNNWLYSYVGETIKAGELKEMQLLSFLTEKGKKLEKPKQLEASLDIVTEAFSSEWVSSVPVKISIGLGGEVDDPTCFTITRKDWKAGTEGVPIEIQFEAQNNCSIGGVAVSLRNISAKVEWETNQLGTFSIRTPENAIDLRTGYAKKFAGVLMPEESIPIVLAFTPNGGINGKAVAAIVFSAENPTEAGTQLLTGEVSAELTVVNLVDCIAFSKEILIIKPEKSDSFEIETIGCGPDNDFKLESELTLSHERFILGGTARKEIEVFAEKNIAGQYPIMVYAKGSDEIQEKLIKTIRARILASGCLELSRYEFDVFDNPENPYDGYDTAEIINHCYNKPVTVHVKYDEHDWGEALKTGAIFGIIGAVVGGFAESAADAKANLPKPPPKGGEKAGSAAGGGFSLGDALVGGLGWFLGLPGRAVSALSGGGGQPEDGGEPVEPSQPKAKYGMQDTEFTAEEFVGRYGNGRKEISPDGKSFTVYDYEGKNITGRIEDGRWKIETEEIIEPVYAKQQFEIAGPTGFQSMGGGIFDGMLGGMVMGMGKSIMGEPSALGWGLWSFAIGTGIAYINQDEGDFSVNTIQKDLVYGGVDLLMPGATLEEDRLVETPSTDIIVRDLEETSTVPSSVDRRLSIEKMKIGFLNVEGIVQPDPATPLYRVLKVDGERLGYKTEYEMDEKTQPSIEINERKQHWERFKLQFNAFDPMTVVTEAKPIANCTLGTIVGVTGPNAVPKVKFDWSWSKIGEDNCDEGNEGYIYCDATQFSIEVLKKVQKLRDFIEANKPFRCPSTGRSTAVREQELTGTAYDVGLTKIQANLVGEGDVNVFAVAESNNGQLMEAELRIDLKAGETLVKSCTRQFDLISKSTESCSFSGVADGDYQIEAVITPTLCPGCENSDSENDSIEAVLLIGSSGIAECQPYNTKRLAQFLEASNYSQQQIEQVNNLVNFNAYLIKDAYTNDFRADFDQFCKEKSFFDCPQYYLEDEGLHRFFTDAESFNFDYSLAPHAAADAGKYSVTIDIEFDNQNWDFFENGQPDATVNVEMTELSAPEPDSPFYYLPFDGTVGVDSENGRQGYGINFRQISQETIKINNVLDQTILSTNIAGSTPIFNGWIDAGFADEFGIVNQTKRGILLDVQAGSEATKIVLSPSYATPVMMRVDYEKGSDAYAFYSIEIDYSPQTAFIKMMPWSGIGVNCRDFADNPVTEAWQDTWDKHGGISGNLSCAVGTDITDYGLEWCNPKRNGSVFLQSVVFTPQNKRSLMKRTAYSDDMALYNAGDSGSQIALNGVAGMPNNSYGTSGIDSIEDVFDLVEENKVCLIGQGSRISNRFFWNPKVVLEEISSQRSMADEECIKSS